MLKGLIFHIFIVLFSCSAQAQSDSTQQAEEKTKWIFAFDARRSAALQEKIKIGGLKIGERIGDRFQLGIGFYGMSDPIRRHVPMDKNQFPESVDTVLFDFDYTTLFFEKIWFHSKRWEVTTPIHFGIGSLKLDYLTNNPVNRKKNFIKAPALTSEISITAQYKFWRWFAVGSGFGYRKILVNDEQVSKALDAPVYIFQMKLLIGELYKSVFKKGENPDGW